MIVSASRRTDVPAFYAAWLAGRIAAGEAQVANPFRPTQVRRVDLRPAPAGALDALVLWTRNPAPALAYLAEWEARGVHTLWLVTVTGYPRVLEPEVPRVEDVATALRELCRVVGRHRIGWRYDPVLLAPGVGIDAAFHRRNFRRLARELAPWVGRCVVSAFDDYAKSRGRLARAGATPTDKARALELLAELADVAREHRLPLQTCAEEGAPPGVEPGACIDRELLRELWGLELPAGTDPGQRRHCSCVPAVDIGAYDTCSHGCLYCYATGAQSRVVTRQAAHRQERPRLA